jgi:hypothetical protein
MNITQSSLVIIGANTPECKVFWNGQEVQSLGVSVSFDNKVTIKIAEDPILAEMTAAGIRIARVTQ